MKKVFLMALCIFALCDFAYAGLLNDSEGVVDFINKIEGKAGYIWYPQQKEYVPMVSGSLYTFKAEKETNQFRIGSIDLGYSKLSDTLGITNDSEKNIVFLATMIDSKILETFSVPVPKIGNLELMAGLAIGIDIDKIGDLEMDKLDDGHIIRWGIPTVGLKLKF